MKSVISKREIPKDLQGVSGLRTGFHPPDAQHTRLVITGQPGGGKSTFLNSNPHLVMLDPERGGDTVADPRAMRFTPPPGTPPEELDKAYLGFVDRIIARHKKGATDIQMIGIDTGDKLISIFQKVLCLQSNVVDVGDVGGGHGKGYFMVRDSIFGMLDKAYQAGLGWAIILHTKTRYVQVGDTERPVASLSISDSYKAAAFQECEHMMSMERGMETVKGKPEVKIIRGKEITKPGRMETRKVRKLKTNPGGTGGGTSDVKVRVPLEDEMVIPEIGGWDVFVSAYDRAVASLQEGEKV